MYPYYAENLAENVCTRIMRGKLTRISTSLWKPLQCFTGLLMILWKRRFGILGILEGVRHDAERPLTGRELWPSSGAVSLLARDACIERRDCTGVEGMQNQHARSRGE